MPNPIITIKDWSTGIVQDFTNPAGFAHMHCVDIHRNPGELAVQLRFDEDDDDVFNTNSEYLIWMAPYDGSGTDELMGYGSGGGIYRRVSGTWQRDRDVSASFTSDGQGFSPFDGKMYYASRSRLGELDGDPAVGGSYNDSLQTFTTALGPNDKAPMLEFAGSLYIGNDRYISRLESGGITYTADALTLASGYKIYALTEWNGYIVGSTKSALQTQDEIIFIWDGISEFPDRIIKVPKPGATSLFDFNNRLMAFINNKIMQYTGSDFDTVFQIPNVDQPDDLLKPFIDAGSVDLYEERMLFAVSQDIAVNETKFKSGIWSFGRNNISLRNALVYDFQPSTGATGKVEYGALSSFGIANDREIMYVSYRDFDNAEYHVDVLNTTERYATAAYIVTNAFEVSDKGDNYRLIKGVRIYFEGDMSTQSTKNKVEVQYRINNDIDYHDDTTGWTTLGEIDNDSTGNDNQDDILYGIYEKAERIQFKFNFTTNSGFGGDNLQLIKINIY